MTVTLVAGPPCSGKTTYALAHAAAGDEVLDYDVVFAELSGLPLYEREFGHADAVGAEFQRRLARIRQGFVIRCAPNKQHRAIIRRIHRAASVVLAVPAEICHARLRASDRPEQVKPGLHQAIDAWWDEYEPSTSADETVSDGGEGQTLLAQWPAHDQAASRVKSTFETTYS